MPSFAVAIKRWANLYKFTRTQINHFFGLLSILRIFYLFLIRKWHIKHIKCCSGITEFVFSFFFFHVAWFMCSCLAEFEWLEQVPPADHQPIFAQILTPDGAPERSSTGDRQSFRTNDEVFADQLMTASIGHVNRKHQNIYCAIQK